MIAKIKYLIALLFPFWDGDAPGRPFTRYEQEIIDESIRRG
jgi:hypothetical protein